MTTFWKIVVNLSGLALLVAAQWPTIRKKTGSSSIYRSGKGGSLKPLLHLALAVLGIAAIVLPWTTDSAKAVPEVFEVRGLQDGRFRAKVNTAALAPFAEARFFAVVCRAYDPRIQLAEDVNRQRTSWFAIPRIPQVVQVEIEPSKRTSLRLLEFHEIECGIAVSHTPVRRATEARLLNSRARAEWTGPPK